MIILRPETVVRWHRAGLRRYWRWKSGCVGGRPHIAAELRALIWRMSVDNRLWGAPHIHGELLKLGFTAVLMMLVVSALTTFMDVSRAAKITLAAVVRTHLGRNVYPQKRHHEDQRIKPDFHDVGSPIPPPLYRLLLRGGPP
jgi:hypothetical protein